uniref:UBC core domain-containing protein n=1 Tax=Sinocyclocheilus rhinocerous TaxID=307959 RepID=A0A673KKG5_9TELE
MNNISNWGHVGGIHQTRLLTYLYKTKVVVIMHLKYISAFWRIVMKGPPETPYENGTFELYCQFGHDYPVKPPVVRFYTPIYHCNINSVGRICHNIFDRNYSADVTMREILDAVYGLLILPECDVEVPPHLVCPLSGKMFIDPVKAKGGYVYERRAIEEHLKM